MTFSYMYIITLVVIYPVLRYLPAGPFPLPFFFQVFFFKIWIPHVAVIDSGPTWIAYDVFISRSLLTSAKIFFPNKVTFIGSWN